MHSDEPLRRQSYWQPGSGMTIKCNEDRNLETSIRLCLRRLSWRYLLDCRDTRRSRPQPTHSVTLAYRRELSQQAIHRRANSTAIFASPLTISSTFNSLFKVLFAFPSRYLFAISLVVIFSFGWNLPPFSALIPKNATQSARTVRTDTSVMNGTVTLLGAPFQETFTEVHTGRSPKPHFAVEDNDWALSFSLFIRHYWGNPS